MRFPLPCWLSTFYKQRQLHPIPERKLSHQEYTSSLGYSLDSLQVLVRFNPHLTSYMTILQHRVYINRQTRIISGSSLFSRMLMHLSCDIKASK